jgi:hypothetical protein
MQATTLTRREDWPEQLAAQVAAAQAKPYLIGVHDCLRFSCLCIEAMTGHDYWPTFAGYTTRREAVEKLQSIAPTLAEAAALVLGVDPAPAIAARRGDLLVYRDKLGEHMGVCTGGHVAVLGHSGLVMVRLDHPGLQNCVRVA